MSKKVLLMVVFAMFQQAIMSQEETCDDPKDEIVIDLNSISKCAIDGSQDEKNSTTAKNANRVAVKAPRRRRIIRKRNAASSANVLSANNSLDKIKKNTSIVGDLNLNSNSVAEKLPFSFVEEKPSFSKCANASGVAQTNCFKTEISKHIKANFRYPQNSFDKSIQGRVLIQFVIDELGNITDIITRGPIQGEELEKEAKRIIQKLPKLNPGKINGVPVKVKYGTAIGFRIPGRKASNVKVKKVKVRSEINAEELKDVVNFTQVQQVPLFEKCNNKYVDDKKKCFNSEMSEHIKKYFVYPDAAKESNIQGRVYAYFTINKKGKVVNINARGPKGGEALEKATKLLISKLPKFIPGKQNGKKVNVKHTFPIGYKIN